MSSSSSFSSRKKKTDEGGKMELGFAMKSLHITIHIKDKDFVISQLNEHGMYEFPGYNFDKYDKNLITFKSIRFNNPRAITRLKLEFLSYVISKPDIVVSSATVDANVGYMDESISTVIYRAFMTVDELAEFVHYVVEWYGCTPYYTDVYHKECSSTDRYYIIRIGAFNSRIEAQNAMYEIFNTGYANTPPAVLAVQLKRPLRRPALRYEEFTRNHLDMDEDLCLVTKPLFVPPERSSESSLSVGSFKSYALETRSRR